MHFLTYLLFLPLFVCGKILSIINLSTCKSTPEAHSNGRVISLVVVLSISLKRGFCWQCKIWFPSTRLS